MTRKLCVTRSFSIVSRRYNKDVRLVYFTMDAKNKAFIIFGRSLFSAHI